MKGKRASRLNEASRVAAYFRRCASPQASRVYCRISRMSASASLVNSSLRLDGIADRQSEARSLVRLLHQTLHKVRGVLDQLAASLLFLADRQLGPQPLQASSALFEEAERFADRLVGVVELPGGNDQLDQGLVLGSKLAWHGQSSCLREY